MRIFSGIRPTGDLHIGNYLGAIKQWVEIQNTNECIFCIVDLHAITTPFNSKELQKNIFEEIVCYVAAGIDPQKCIIFVQSKVKEHTELAWLLSTITPLGELKRMTQFKEKIKKHPKYVNAGILNYPLLMAADILLYQTDKVPVGKDQQQHVELTRQIAHRFNKIFGETFREPEVMLPKQGAKIMSLRDPRKKMSKTDDPRGCIEIFSSPEEIKKKIMTATTDLGKEIRYDLKGKPGISNLLTIYSLFSGQSIKELEKKFKNTGYETFKKSLAEVLIKKLESFRRKKEEIYSQKDYVNDVLDQGRIRAEAIAQKTMQKVKKQMGLL